MNEIINLLLEGISKDYKLATTMQEQLERLLKEGIAILENGFYHLAPRFGVAKIYLSKKGRGIAKFQIPFGKKELYLPDKLSLNHAKNGDIALVKSFRKSPNMGRVIYILQKNKRSVLCVLEQYGLEFLGIGLQNEVAYKLKASSKSLRALPKDVVLKINPDNGEILEVLGRLQDPNIDETISLALYGKNEKFSFNAELEAKKFGDKLRLKNYEERVNLSHLPFCVIDPKDAKDHDDAIFYDTLNSTLYVAIADVSHYVTPNSYLDQEAQKRGFSIYFPHKSIPMLPRSLSENLCSLKENHLRLAMVWKIRLHRRTKAVLEAEIFEAIIKVKQKLTYDEVDELFEKGISKIIKPTSQKMLKDLKDVILKLREKRLKVGYDFLNHEYRLLLNTHQKISGILQEKQTLSHNLIEECMLLANIQSALLLSKKNTKNDKDLKLGIYRIHPKPRLDNIKELFYELQLLGLVKNHKIPKNLEEFHKNIQEVQKKAKRLKIQEQVDKLIIKSMSQASYAAHNVGHFGLGFTEYSHFTSPIRRYSDLILHRLIKEKIKIVEDYGSKGALLLLCENLNHLEQEASKVELDFKDRKFARYLNEHIGTTYEGIITNENTPQLITLTNYPVVGARVTCLKGEGVKYQKARVEILEVNIATTRVYGRIVELFNEEAMGLKNKQYAQNYFKEKKERLAKKKEARAQNEANRIKKSKQKALQAQKAPKRKAKRKRQKANKKAMETKKS
ncbi:ribonuclease [Helicobacter valdiviensis]|uniref:Ribonuclease n=1 Tax=Helicobacter valdiviensis TaxID=1458358 RepID=A0A2W6PPX5_9HELI|nr:ribonuclease R family protein [Helicobacter valdiviensis]PZT48773.1 ribonuclease [Helicobacter valdiviensis]